MDLRLSPDDIERLVKETILKSSFGQMVANSVTKCLDSYNSPVDEAVKQAIRQTIAILLDSPEYKPKMVAACRAAIESRLTDDLMQKLTSATLDKIQRAASSDY